MGGYNGGGDANLDRGSGGGMTDIRYFKDNINSSIIIAAGGGGAHREQESCAYQNGGDGGGIEGLIGGNNNKDIPCIPNQFSCINGKGTYSLGTLGKGVSNKYGGGGGGYFGGGAASCAASSGGSSYIDRMLGNPIFIPGFNDGYGYASIELYKSLFITIKKTNMENTVFIYIFLLI